MRKLKLADTLVTIVISIAFGIVYILWGSLYYAVMPFGLHIEQLIYGMWFIAAIVAYLIIQKPGVALLAEIAAASGEFLLGSPFGLPMLLYGLVQGLFAELIFMAFRYKKHHLFVAILAGISACIGSLLMDVFYGEITNLALWNVSLLIITRMIGSIFFAGICAYLLVKVLETTGVTRLVRPVTKSDFDALHR